MTFLHPKDNDTLEIWKEYYKKLESKIPQNKLGTNPGKISLSSKIDIIHFFETIKIKVNLLFIFSVNDNCYRTIIDKFNLHICTKFSENTFFCKIF